MVGRAWGPDMGRRFLIGSPSYERLICDWAVRNQYDLMVPQDETDLTKLSSHASVLWKTIPEPDPYELLMAAILADAARDWVECMMDGELGVAQEIEQWFEENPYGEAVLNELKRLTRNCKTYREWKMVCNSIRLIR